ncbi:hypothetical protein LCGC14_0549860 [marine sediment metagenome]|uniref:Uncharacterized protein n=1 Tax=marine sediment metagenome TaxID=412755 RepID=A0A0F9RV47_9ZZZZ
MPETKILITVDHKVLLGCYDMLSVYGGDPRGQQAENVISLVLMAFVNGMRDDKLIPTYNTETELLTKLDEYFPDLKNSVINKIEDMAVQLERTMQGGDSSFSDVKKDIDPSAVDNIQIDDSENEEGESEKALTFEELPGKDVLVIEAKGDSRKESSLLEVYSVISREIWGTPNARKMWELILSKKGETPTEPSEDLVKPTEPSDG